MSQYMQGGLRAGDGYSETAGGFGYSVFSQTASLAFVLEVGAGSDNVDATLVLPKYSRIHEIYVDTLTAWDSVTSAGLTVGTTAGGTELLGSSDVKSNGRETTAPTAAQLAVWDNIGATTTTVYIRVAQVGNTSAGAARVTVVYSITT